VKKASLTSVLCMLLALTSACQKKEPANTQTPAAESRKIDFVPPSDSAVTADQVKKWIICNTYLDSLSLLYKDSFSINDAAKRMAYQDHFVKAQDRICVRVGLTGGYAEYLWVLKASGSPRNKAIVDSLKLTAFR
jgi:hypothetical protein